MTSTIPVPTLTAGSVVLRAPRPDDAQGVWEQCQDPLSQRWTSVPIPYSHADAEQFVGQVVPDLWEQGTEHILVIEAEGRFAGSVALRPMSHDRAEIGYGAHPWVRGTGHVHTALGLLLDWGFDPSGQGLGLETVEWRAQVGNWRSRKSAWRLGFEVSGVLHRWLPHRGELVDCWVAALHRDDPRRPRGRWLSSPVVEGDGVRLRALALQDVPRIVEGCRDDVTRFWLSRLPEATEDDALRMLESVSDAQARGDGTTWAIADAGTDTFLGAAGLFDVGEQDCEVTYWLHPDARGRGAAVEATRLATGWAFRELGMARVEAHAGVDNVASRAVLTAAGYREGGVVRHGTRTRSGPADAVHFDVLAAEWGALTPSR